MAYNVLLLVHVLAFVYWLGADLGVLYAAKYGSDERLSIETRQTIGGIMAFVDLFPRLSVPLIGATGITMAYLSGAFQFAAAWIGFVWLAAAIWISLNLFVFLNRASPDRVRPVVKFDTLWRVILLSAIIAVAVASFFGKGMTTNMYLASKLLIFALAIVLSLILRMFFKPYRPALARILADGDNVRNSAIMRKALARARPVVISIWVLTVIAAAIGLWMPI